MKNIQLFIFIFIFFCQNIYSQDSVLFNVEYKPNYKYEQIVEQNSIQKIVYEGSDEILNKLKANGIENPTFSNTSSTLKSVNKTGKIKNNQIPLTIEFIETLSSDGKELIPNGTKIFGNIKIGQMPTLDSIYSPKMEAELKKIFLTTIQSGLSQIELPNQKIKIGETITREMPLVLPIGSENLKMTNTITYKLIKIENNKGYFDITQDYTVKITDKKDNFFAKGSGDGILVFDIANNFYLKYELNSDINMEVVTASFKAKINSQSKFSQNTIISKQ